MDLSQAATDQHWKKHCKQVSTLLFQMSRRETWAMDEDLAGWLVALGRALDQDGTVTNMVDRPVEVVQFVSWLSTPSALRVIDHLETELSGSTTKMIDAARQESSGPMGQLFIERLELLKNTKLLSQVFSPERMLLVVRALTEIKEPS